MRFVGLLPAILPTAVTIFAAALLFGATPSQATPEQGVDVGATVSVEVASTSPSASPSASASPTASAGASTPSTSAPTSGTSGPATSEPTGGTTTGPGGEQSLGGVLYVSGLTWEYHPSINPLGGALDLHFTVRNVSTKPATGSARMWLNGIFGVQVGQLVDVPVTDLKPG